MEGWWMPEKKKNSPFLWKGQAAKIWEQTETIIWDMDILPADLENNLNWVAILVDTSTEEKSQGLLDW